MSAKNGLYGACVIGAHGLPRDVSLTVSRRKEPPSGRGNIDTDAYRSPRHHITGICDGPDDSRPRCPGPDLGPIVQPAAVSCRSNPAGSASASGASAISIMLVRVAVAISGFAPRGNNSGGNPSGTPSTMSNVSSAVMKPPRISSFTRSFGI